MFINTYKTKNIYIGKLEYESDLLESVNKFCDKKNINKGFIHIIGALKKSHLGFYDQQKRKYVSMPLNKPVEIINCIGNISLKDGKPFAHIHLIVSDDEGNTKAGHTMPGCIIFAGEIFIQEVEGPDLIRGFDDITGLPLWLNLE